MSNLETSELVTAAAARDTKAYITAPYEGAASDERTAYEAALKVIAKSEPTIAGLIASENYASPAVMLAMGNWLSDKYAEGVPGHRFYAGCEYVDQIETLAANHAKALFGADHAYVQPHSGIDANLVAFWSILAHRVEAPYLVEHSAKHINDLNDADWEKLRKHFGDQKMIGMSLDAGGHLTHGFRPNISGKLFSQKNYGVNADTELLDYDKVRELARDFKPLILIAGYSAYPRKVNFAKMREIADEIGATFMVDMAHFAGLVAGKQFTGDFDPVPFAHVVTTTTHKSLRGPRGGMVLCKSELAEFVDKGCPMVLGGPIANMMAAKAVAFAEARQPSFVDYAKQIVDNANALAEGLVKRGARLVTGGTDNHLVVADTRSFGLTGRQAETALEVSGIIVNRNSIPNDPNGAWYTSGVRLGTPALTTIGLGTADMDEVADIIASVLKAAEPTQASNGPSLAKFALDPKVIEATRARCAELLSRHPLYASLGVL